MNASCGPELDQMSATLRNPSSEIPVFEPAIPDEALVETHSFDCAKAERHVASVRTVAVRHPGVGSRRRGTELAKRIVMR